MKNKMKQSLSIAILIVMILNVFVGCGEQIESITSDADYEDTIKNVINAFEAHDLDTLYSYASCMVFFGDDEYEDYSFDIEDAHEIFDLRVSSKYDLYEQTYGQDLEIDYKILDSYEVDYNNGQSLWDEINYTGKISAIRMLELELTIKDSTNATYKHTTHFLMLVKENEEWKVLYRGY
ncbi:MAG: hypothetical protein IJD78_03210 [Clostridia bacterium]|nr:hypothetical protein [Clostridia bacterium]MBQ3006550.1 hypothetical protein [Clostridia bacterium]